MESNCPNRYEATLQHIEKQITWIRYLILMESNQKSMKTHKLINIHVIVRNENVALQQPQYNWQYSDKSHTGSPDTVLPPILDQWRHMI